MSNEELVKLYQQGDKKALEELIRNNEGMVHAIANRFYIKNNAIEKDDLIQEGCLGVINAAKRYNLNHEKKANFLTYMFYCVQTSIGALVAGKTSKDKKNLELNYCTSLNKELGEKSKTELGDILEDETNSIEELEHKMYIQELHKDLTKLMNEHLSLKEREVIALFFGWDGFYAMQLKEIDELLKVNSALEKNKALNKLRKTSWARKKINEHLEEQIMEIKSRSMLKEKNVDMLIILEDVRKRRA